MQEAVEEIIISPFVRNQCLLKSEYVPLNIVVVYSKLAPISIISIHLIKNENLLMVYLIQNVSFDKDLNFKSFTLLIIINLNP